MAHLPLDDFLAHLWRYWLVTRVSQAKELKEDRSLRFVPLVEVQRTDEVLRALWLRRSVIRSTYTDAEASGCYFPHLQVLRLRRAGFAQLLGPEDFADDDFRVFYRGHPFYDRVREFVNEQEYRGWRTKPEDLSDYLAAALFEESAAGLPSDVAHLADCGFFATVLHAVKSRTCWIGLRDLTTEEAQRFPTWTQDRCIRELTTSVAPNRAAITYLRRTQVRGWWRVRPETNDLTQLADDAPRFQLLSEELTSALLEDNVIADVGREQITILTVTARTALIGDFVSEQLRPDSVLIVVSMLPSAEVESLISSVLDEHAIDLRCVIVGRTELEESLSRYPWLWSKYFGLRDVTIAQSRESDRLLDALLPEPPLLPLEGKGADQHPALTGMEDISSRIAIVGRRGTGKSTALYHVARRYPPECVVVVLRPGGDATVLPMIEQLVRAFPSLIVIDDLELAPVAWLPAVLSYAAPVSVAVAYCASERRVILERYWKELERFASFDMEQVYGDYGKKFWESVALRAARKLKVPTPKDWVQLFMASIRYWTPTLSVMLWNLSQVKRKIVWHEEKNRPLLAPPVEQRYWLTKFHRLRHDTGAADQRLLLTIVHAFYWLDAFAVCPMIVQECFCYLAHAKRTQFELAWTALQDDGWISTHGETVQSDIINVSPIETGTLLDYYTPSPFLLDFCRWCIDDKSWWEWRELLLDRLFVRLQELMAPHLTVQIGEALLDAFNTREHAQPERFVPLDHAHRERVREQLEQLKHKVGSR